MTWKFTNNASAVLSLPLSVIATTVRLESGAGALYPVLAVGDTFAAALVAEDGRFEIVKAISRTDDFVEVVRGQEGTAASTFDIGSRFELRLTAAVMDDLLQGDGGLFTGDIDMQGHSIRNVNIPDNARMGRISVSGIRAPDRPFDDPNTARVLQFPTGGGRITIGSSPVLTAQFFGSIVFMWAGPSNTLPTWFKLCNGLNGTPDLRNRFILGASLAVEPALGSTGGALEIRSDVSGVHNHNGATGYHTLDYTQVPAVGSFSNDREDDDGGTQSITSLSIEETAEAPHRHAIAADLGHSHLVRIVPPYYALAFVMFDFDNLG